MSVEVIDARGGVSEADPVSKQSNCSFSNSVPGVESGLREPVVEFLGLVESWPGA